MSVNATSSPPPYRRTRYTTTTITTITTNNTTNTLIALSTKNEPVADAARETDEAKEEPAKEEPAKEGDDEADEEKEGVATGGGIRDASEEDDMLYSSAKRYRVVNDNKQTRKHKQDQK